ncbi:MAG: alpha-2-macroglobulin family protein [Flavobacteriales bacterium]
MKRFLLLTLALFLLFSCGEKGDLNQVKQSKTSMVSYHRANGSSCREAISIKLKSDTLAATLMQEELDLLFEFKPKVEGKVVKDFGGIYRFAPETKFEYNTTYKVKFNEHLLSKTTTDNVYEFEFTTSKLNANFNLRSYEAYNKNLGYCSGHINFSDYVQLSEISSCLDDNNLNIKWLSEDNVWLKQINFKIDSLTREVDDAVKALTFYGTKIGLDRNIDRELLVPGKNKFKHLGTHLKDTKNQVIEVNFSDPLKKNQNFEGLVQLGKNIKCTFSVDGSKLSIYPKTRLESSEHLVILKGLSNESGFQLKTDYQELIHFKQQNPELKLLSKGSILPNSDGLKINFESTNLSGVYVKVFKIHQNNILQFLQNNSNFSSANDLHQVGNEIYAKRHPLFQDNNPEAHSSSVHAIDLAKLIAVDPGAVYRVELSFGPKESAYSFEKSADFKTYEANYNHDLHYQRVDYELIDWNDKDNPGSISFYYYQKNKLKKSMNVLASDLGVIAKKDANNSIHTWVVDMIDNKTVGNAKVDLYSYQQQVIASGKTNSLGHCEIDCKDQQAAFLVVSRNKEKTYLKIMDGLSLSLADYNVSGTRMKDGLKGFMYFDRGVRRPGDALPVTFVLDDSKRKKPQDLPVIFELYNAESKLVDKSVVKSHLNQVYFHEFRTKTEDKTGNWHVKVRVGSQVFQKIAKIETVKPNRLKINLDFEDEFLDLSKSIEGTISSTWLHGAIAKNLKADIQVKTQGKALSFEKFPAFNFNNTFSRNKVNYDDLTVFDGELDENGAADFSFDLELDPYSSGLVRSHFLSKVYEKGGDFSINVVSKDAYTYESFAGLKSPDGADRWGTLVNGKAHQFGLVNLNKNGKPLANRSIEAKVYKIQWRWWWQSRNSSMSQFLNGIDHELVIDKELKTNSKGKTDFNVTFPENTWGRYLVLVKDLESGHIVSEVVYADDEEWVGRYRGNQNNETAHSLDFSTDKEEYKVGETAKITIPSTGKGKTLLSIETSTDILETFWVESKNGNSVFELKIDERMSPNIYIFAHHLQKHAETENDEPMRLYGVKNLNINNPETKLEPVITMPDELKPETSFTVEVSEKAGQPMTYTIQIVDDGLLDLTNYNTPNPWSSFYAKEALGVKTWDMYNQVIGAYGGTANQVLAVGGDADLAGGKKKSANRFRPVAMHFGPFELLSYKSKTHTITLPNYIGSVRTMVVASSPMTQAYGSSEKTCAVKKPVMLLASVPRTLSPNERFTLPVNVFVMDKKVKTVDVELKLNEAFEVIGPSKQKLNFTGEGDQMAYFEVKTVKQAIGKIELLAQSNNDKATYKTEIDVVNPNPYEIRKWTTQNATKGELTIDFEAFGELGSNSYAVEFSNFPSINMEGRLNYLIRYPYGCLEQTSSKAFAQLVLGETMAISEKRQKQIQKNIELALRRLQSFQNTSGGLSYWPHSSYYESWAELYAGHFVLEAKNQGYLLPYGFEEKYMNHLQNQVSNYTKGSSHSFNQAYRLYVLALGGQKNLSAMNRLREEDKLNDLAKFRLAQAYALIGQKSIAKGLVESIKNINLASYGNYNRYSYGSNLRNRALILETYLSIDETELATNQAKHIAESLNSTTWHSTQTTAYALLAMSKYLEKNKSENTLHFDYQLDGVSKGHHESKDALISFGDSIAKGNHKLVVENKSNSALFVNVVAKGKLEVGDESSTQRGLEISTLFKDLEGNAIVPSSLQQGQNFIAEIEVYNPTSTFLRNVAVSQIFPSGWEIINTRFTDFDLPENSSCDYTDIRDDRVNYFMSLSSRSKKVFRVMLNASYLGHYYFPGVQGEAMYNNDFYVRTKGQFVDVRR